MVSVKKLQCVAISAAESLGIELTRVRLDETTGDWQSFRRAGVDTLNFHSLNKPMIAMLHTYRDRRDLVDDDQFISAYRVIANTISALDHGVDVSQPLHVDYQVESHDIFLHCVRPAKPEDEARRDGSNHHG